MRLIPVVADADVDDQWHVEACGGSHAFADAVYYFSDGVEADFEDQFIVDLQQQAGVGLESL